MKLKFRSKALIAFGIGASLFVTTAFADMMLGSGYDKLKESAKFTAAQLATGLDSYTIEGSLHIKIDEQNLSYQHSIEKYDMKNEKYEELSVNDSFQDQHEHFRYRDHKQTVWKNFDDENLYVSEYPEDYFEIYPNDTIGYIDPFQEDGAVEVEKIVDAVVGNLQDLILVENAEQGGYIFNSSLNSSQVPALVNAVSSYIIKLEYNNVRRYNNASHLPELSSDISIQSISGQVYENEQGLITSLNAQLLLNGKDVNGIAHTIEVNIDQQISDINKTVVETPDLSNAIKEDMYSSRANEMIKNNTVGTYTNNIVIEENGQLIKIGERTLQIESISNDDIVGKLTEVVYEGYEDHYNAIQYNFTGIIVLNSIVVVQYTDSNGNESTAVSYKQHLDSLIFMPDVIVDIRDKGSYGYSDTKLENFNTNFTRVFD